MGQAESGAPVFGAFISYKRSDEKFALMLEKALERFTPPKGLNLPQGHLNIFRDREDLTGTEYHASIEKYLHESAKLILLCSPQSRASSYVNEEIQRFAQTKGASNIIPILLSGIPNNEATAGQEADMAFPAALCALVETPLATDYRGFDPARDRVESGRFEGSWYTVLANIYDVSRGDLEQRDRRRQARRRRTQTAIAAAVGVMLLSLTVWAMISRQEAISRQLAASSVTQLSIDPEQSVLLASEALQTRTTSEAEVALRNALLHSHVRKVFRGHTDWVNDFAFSPSGRMLATASSDHTVRIWDIAASKETTVLQHSAEVSYVRFAPKDDTKLLTVSGGKTQVWNLASGSATFEVTGNGTFFSPDGTQLITIGSDGTKVWDAATAKLVWEQRSHPPACASYSPDGKTILLCVDASAELWKIGSKQPLRDFAHQGGVTHAEFNKDGSLVVTSGEDRMAKVWQVSGNKSWTSENYPRSVIWAGFSRETVPSVLAVSDKGARVWTSEKEIELRGHTDWVTSADFSPDGRFAVTTSQDGSARVWDTKTGFDVADLLGHTDSVLKAQFSPDGKSVVTVSADRTVRIWDITVGVQLLGHTSWVTSAAFDPGGQRVVTSGWDATARIWNAETGELLRVDKETQNLNRAAFSPDGKFIVTVGVWPVGHIRNSSTGEFEGLLPGHASEVFTAAYSHDGTRIVTAGGGDGMVKVWNSATQKEELTISPHGNWVTSAIFSPDDRYILTTGVDQKARVFELATKESVVFEGHTGVVWGGAISPNGLWAVTASGDMTGRIWETRTGREVAVLRGHTARLTDATFSPNGRLVVTASADKTARVWEAATGRLVVVLQGHTDLVSSASFSPDSKRILTSSDDGTARIVECSVCESSDRMLLDLAKTRVTRDLPPEQQSRLARFLRRFGVAL